MSSQYDVFGIGNALVDIEVEVGEEELKQLGVEKGIMTLIDEARQNALLAGLKGVHHNRCCGGSAANTVIGVAQLGGKAFYTCKIGNDETGDFYFADLKRNGVASNLETMPRPEGVTGKCLALVTPDADRTMNTFLGITSDIGPENIQEDALRNSRYVYVEGYLVSSATAFAAAKETLRLARKHGVKTALSFSDPAMTRFFPAQLRELLAEPLDLLFCNEDEALAFTGSGSLADAVAQLRRQARRLVVTRGRHGALVADDAGELAIAAHAVTAVDTTGAGDLFAGAFLAALTQGQSPEIAGRLASFASAELVTRYGARLDELGLAKVRAFHASLM